MTTLMEQVERAGDAYRSPDFDMHSRKGVHTLPLSAGRLKDEDDSLELDRKQRARAAAILANCISEYVALDAADRFTRRKLEESIQNCMTRLGRNAAYGGGWAFVIVLGVLVAEPCEVVQVRKVA